MLTHSRIYFGLFHSVQHLHVDNYSFYEYYMQAGGRNIPIVKFEFMTQFRFYSVFLIYCFFFYFFLNIIDRRFFKNGLIKKIL